MKKEGLRVLTTIPAAPTTLYLAWLSSEQHSAMTGGVAKIDATVGGKYSAWGGYISGKLVILDLGRRLVMSWRTTDFPREAPDSRVEIFFEALGASTRLTILHTEIPEGQAEKYKAMWNEKYFGPMRTFFSKYLPDPRKPPPPRRPPPPPEEEEEEAAPVKRGKVAAKAPPPPPTKEKPRPVKVAPPPSKAKIAPAKSAPAKAPVKSAPSKTVPAKAAKTVPAKAAKAPAKAAKAAKPAPKAPAKKPAAKAPAKKPAAKKPAAKPAKKKK
jgi:hypothetical protein